MNIVVDFLTDSHPFVVLKSNILIVKIHSGAKQRSTAIQNFDRGIFKLTAIFKPKDFYGFYFFNSGENFEWTKPFDNSGCIMQKVCNQAAF